MDKSICIYKYIYIVSFNLGILREDRLFKLIRATSMLQSAFGSETHMRLMRCFLKKIGYFGRVRKIIQI